MCKSLAASILVLAAGQISAQFGGINLGSLTGGGGFGTGRSGISNLVGQLTRSRNQFGGGPQFGNQFGGNQFGNQFGGNQFGDPFGGSQFGNQFGGNQLGNQLGGNQFGGGNGVNNGPIVRSQSFSDGTGPVFNSNSISSSTGDFDDFNGFDSPNTFNNQNNFGTQGGFGNNNGGFGNQNGFGTQGGFTNNLGGNDALSNSRGFSGGLSNGPASIGGDLTQERGVITINALISGGSPPPAVFEWTVQQPDGTFVTFNAGERGSSPVQPAGPFTPAQATLTVREPADISREFRLRVATDPSENNAWSISKSWMAKPMQERQRNNNRANSRRSNNADGSSDQTQRRR